MRDMDDRSVGWIASALMKSNTGIILNIILGFIDAAVVSLLFGILGVFFGGGVAYLIAGLVGACILIWPIRAIPHSS
jgi:uncharacterized membrane protein YeaQ/YmgE (transglycosylase-associated protein family)